MIRRILAAVRWLLRNLLALPGDFARLLGLGGPALPPPAAFEEMADDEADGLREELRAPIREPGLAMRTLGGHVHAYAVSEDRTAFDLALVPEGVAVALLGLDDRQLAVLAAAGPEACGKWALAQRSGIVGLPTVGSTISGTAPEHGPVSRPEREPHETPLLRLAA